MSAAKKDKLGDVKGLLRASPDGVLVSLKVQPRCSRTGPLEVLEGEIPQLKWGVSAAPTDGKANDELIKSAAKLFGLPKSRVRIVSGQSSRSKTVLLEGATLEHTAIKLRDF